MARTFAKIIDGVIRSVVTYELGGRAEPSADELDVTNHPHYDGTPESLLWRSVSGGVIGNKPSPPRAPQILSKNAFMNRFTPTEWMTLRALNNVNVQYWWDQFETASYVDLDDPRVTQGLAVISAALIAAAVWTDRTAETRLAAITAAIQ